MSLLLGIREWFRWYKVPTGKPLNAYEFDEKCMPADFARGVIEETHESWKKLVDGTAKQEGFWVHRSDSESR